MFLLLLLHIFITSPYSATLYDTLFIKGRSVNYPPSRFSSLICALSTSLAGLLAQSAAPHDSEIATVGRCLQSHIQPGYTDSLEGFAQFGGGG
jgi:hypothetical protein